MIEIVTIQKHRVIYKSNLDFKVLKLFNISESVSILLYSLKHDILPTNGCLDIEWFPKENGHT